MYVLPFELNTMAFDFSWLTSSFQEEQKLLNTDVHLKNFVVLPVYLIVHVIRMFTDFSLSSQRPFKLLTSDGVRLR